MYTWTRCLKNRALSFSVRISKLSLASWIPLGWGGGGGVVYPIFCQNPRNTSWNQENVISWGHLGAIASPMLLTHWINNKLNWVKELHMVALSFGCHPQSLVRHSRILLPACDFGWLSWIVGNCGAQQKCRKTPTPIRKTTESPKKKQLCVDEKYSFRVCYFIPILQCKENRI